MASSATRDHKQIESVFLSNARGFKHRATVPRPCALFICSWKVVTCLLRLQGRLDSAPRRSILSRHTSTDDLGSKNCETRCRAGQTRKPPRNCSLQCAVLCIASAVPIAIKENVLSSSRHACQNAFVSCVCFSDALILHEKCAGGTFRHPTNPLNTVRGGRLNSLSD